MYQWQGGGGGGCIEASGSRGNGASICALPPLGEGRVFPFATFHLSIQGLVMKSCLVRAQKESSEDPSIALASTRFGGYISIIGIHSLPSVRNGLRTHQCGWKTAFALNTGGNPGEGTQEDMESNNSSLGSTRLGRIVGAGGRKLLEKLNAARKNFPMKIFLLLLGFYTANALATILGQTGDWDVLVAGIVVAAIEGIGMLVYRKSPPVSSGRFQSFALLVNYWKAGVCLGLFVDAFKLGS